MPDSDLLTECAAILKQMGVADSIIARVVGEMRQRFGGCEIYIPQIDRAGRNQKIIAALESGQPIKAVAKQAGCHQSTARRVRNEWKL